MVAHSTVQQLQGKRRDEGAGNDLQANYAPAMAFQLQVVPNVFTSSDSLPAIGPDLQCVIHGLPSFWLGDSPFAVS